MKSSQLPPPAQGHAGNGAPGGEAQTISDDTVLGTMGHVPPLIPEAEYSAGYVRADKHIFMQRERIFAWWKIVTPGAYFGTELYRVYPCPPGPSGSRKKFGLGSKLVTDAIVALGQRPKRLDQITMQMFKGKVFRVRVRTVVLDVKGKARPEADRYSVIDELLFLEAGASGMGNGT